MSGRTSGQHKAFDRKHCIALALLVCDGSRYANIQVDLKSKQARRASNVTISDSLIMRLYN